MASMLAPLYESPAIFESLSVHLTVRLGRSTCPSIALDVNVETVRHP